LNNISVIGTVAIWLSYTVNIKKTFIVYKNFHIVLHYAVLLFMMIDVVIKGFTYKMSFNDYYGMINILDKNPKDTINQKSLEEGARRPDDISMMSIN
jgi:hypothetical protein